MNWANVTKRHTPPSAKRYFVPPPARRVSAVQTQFRDREWRVIESHCCIAQGDGNALFSPVSLICELPICNKCSAFEENEDVEGLTAGR